LCDTGLTPHQLKPEDDVTLPSYGLGLTDLVKNVAQSHDRGLAYDAPSLIENLALYRPAWVAFTGKAAGEAAAVALGHRPPPLGPVSWSIASCKVFVLPSPSGANRRASYDGRSTRLSWWLELAELAGR
jgi:TDG/mug DNA glycosylase family protein